MRNGHHYSGHSLKKRGGRCSAPPALFLVAIPPEYRVNAPLSFGMTAIQPVTRLAIDAVDQSGEDEIEHLDMMLIEATRAPEKKRCHALEDLGLSLGRAAHDQIVEFRKEQGVHGHHCARRPDHLERIRDGATRHSTASL